MSLKKNVLAVLSRWSLVIMKMLRNPVSLGSSIGSVVTGYRLTDLTVLDHC